MKRALSLIVVLALVLVMVPFSAAAETAELPEYGLCDTMAMGAYTYTWTAPSDGTAEFTLGECIDYTVSITDKNEMEVAIVTDDYGGHSASVAVTAGDTFTIKVLVTGTEGAFVYVSVYCEAPLGSETNPITYDYGVLPTETPIIAGWGEETVWMSFWFLDSNDQPYESLTVTGPAQVTYNGETYTADMETGSVTIPLVLDMSYGRPTPYALMGFANIGRAPMSLQLSFGSGSGDDELIEIGTMENPADVNVMNVGEVILDCSVELDADDADGYWFQWTNDQEVAGIVSFGYVSFYDPNTWMPVSGQLEVEVINPDTFVSSGNMLHDTTADGEEIYNAPLNTVRVPVGHTLKVHISVDGAYAQDGSWTSPAAGVTAQATFVTEEDEQFYIDNNGKAFKSPVAGNDTVSFVDANMGGKTVTISCSSEAAMAEASVLVKTKTLGDWEAEFAEMGTYTANEEGKIVIEMPMGVEVYLAITNGYAYNANFVITQESPVGYMDNPLSVTEGQHEITTVDGVEALYYLSYTADATGYVSVTPVSATLVSDSATDVTESVNIDLYDTEGNWLGSNDTWNGILTAETFVDEGQEILIWVYARNPMNYNIVGVNATVDISLDPFTAQIIREEDGYEVTHLYYNVEAALDEAMAGETVTVIGDSVEDALIIRPGVTLDLGTYDITANYVVGLTGSKLNAERYSNKAGADYGKLIVPQDKLAMTGAVAIENGKNDIIPVWNGVDAYVLANAHINDYDEGYGLVIDEDAKTIDFAFTHAMGGSANADFLKNGADDNALKIVIRLSWENENGVAYQDFVYNADFVGTVAGGGYNYTFKLTGYDVLNIDVNNLTVTAMILTDSGIVSAGAVWDINGANG